MPDLQDEMRTLRDANRDLQARVAALEARLRAKEDAEAALQASEARDRMLFDMMDEGVAINEAVFDANGDVVDYIIREVNPAFERHSSYKPEEVLGKRATDVYNLSPEFISGWWRAHAGMTEVAYTEMYHAPSARWQAISTTAMQGNRFLTLSRNITAHKQSETALRESEERFRLSLKNAPVTVAAQDRDLRFLWAYNQRTVDPSSVVGKTDWEVFPPETAEKLITLKREVLASERETRTQLWVHSGGQRVFLELCLTPMHDQDGRVVGIGIATVDLTQSRLVEEALRLKNLVFDASIAANVITDLEGVITEVNAAALRYWGYATHDEVVGKPMAAFLEEPSAVAAIVAAMDASGEWEGDLTARRRDGSTFVVQALATAVRDADGQVIGYQAAAIDITQRKRAEEKFAKAFRASPVIVTIARIGDGQLLEVNESFEQLLGYAREQAVGRTTLDLGIWADPAERERLVPLLLADGRLRNEQVHFRCKGGEVITCHYSAELVELDGVKCAVAVSQDITEHVRAENALRDSEATLRSITDNLADTIILADRTGQIEFVSRLQPGLAQEQVLSSSVFDFVPPEQRPVVDRALSQVFEHGGTSQYESPGPGPDGESRPYEVKVTPVLVDGRTTSAVFVARDISERKTAEKKIKNSEERYITILTTTQDGFAVCDKLGRYQDVNHQFCEMLGYSREEMLAMSVLDVEAAEDPLEFDEHASRIIETGFDRFDTRYRCKDGKILAIEASVTYKQDEQVYIAFYRDISARVAAEQRRSAADEALRNSEARFRAVIENSNDGILFGDAHATISYRSPSYARINGYSDEERLGHTGFETVHPDDLETVRRYWAHLLAHPEASHKTEYRIQHKDRSWRWVETLGQNLLANPDLQSVVVTSRDITERKLSETALRESEGRYRSLFQANHAAMLVIDPDSGAIVDANPAACAYYGWDRDELLRKRIDDINMLTTEQVHAEMQLARSEKRNHFYFRHRRSDGSIGDVEVYSGPLVLEGRSLLYSIVHDITERRRAEAALRESEERFHSLFDNTTIGMYRTTPDGRILLLNPAGVRMLGYASFGEIAARNLQAEGFAQGDERERFHESMQREGSVLGLESAWTRKDGSTVYVRESATVVKDSAGNRVYYDGTFEDITERKRAEAEREKLQAQLVQAQKMEAVGLLAGGVAHDFNNMLTVIMGHGELALATLHPSEPLCADIQEILKAARRSAEITRQLLAFARKQTIAPRVLDLNATLEGMLKMLRRLIGEDIDLAWMPHTGLWPVKMDPSQVDQILANLCVNARDAIADVRALGAGKVTIATRNVTLDEAAIRRAEGAAQADALPGEYVELTVSDDGIGMDRETLVRIFEPFFTTKPVGQGTGLGLATVYGIVKQNEGYITVSSDRAVVECGRGSTFRIYLPRDAAALGETPAAGAAESPRSRGETILLAEDELGILRMLKRVLEALGYRVLAGATPHEALRLAQEYAGAIDLLITDVVMPGMNGRELAEQLLLLRPRMRCLYMSGYTADAVAHRGVLEGGVLFIQKPMSAHDLAAKVREALDHDPTNR